jgi:hypothetical protein
MVIKLQMGTFPTYGMAGIGIAAAIGFVFVLSFLGSNNGVVDDAGNAFRSDEPNEQQRMDEPMADQESGGDTSLFAKDSQEAMDAAPAEEGASMMQLDTRPKLSSLVALDENREVIGEVVSGMELMAGKPVLIQAGFTNENQAIASDNFITMGITSDGAGDGLSRQDAQFEHAANLQGDIGANSTVELELYWTPQGAGDYTLLVFAEKSGGPSTEKPVEPIASISVRVLE